MNRLSKGASSSYAITFQADDGTTYSPTTAQVVCELLNEEQDIVLDMKSATNTALSPEEWTAIVTYPSVAPSPVRAPFLYLRWSLLVSGTVISQKVYPVEVEFSSADEHKTEDSHIYIAGLPFSAILSLPFESDTVEVYIANSSGTTLYGPARVYSSKVLLDGSHHYRFELPAPISTIVAGSGLVPYNLMWNYTTPEGEYSREVHFLYAISHKAFSLINSLRKYLDKARNFDIDPTLQWEDVELLHFTLEGIHRINGTPPTSHAPWTPNTLPDPLYYAWEKAAAHEALNALYLAEGYRVFNFSGQSTQLEVDRTPFIQTKMDEINSWLDQNLERAKKGVLRGNVVGTLGLDLSLGGPRRNIAPQLGHMGGIPSNIAGRLRYI